MLKEEFERGETIERNIPDGIRGLNVPVALSQYSREKQGRVDHRPWLYKWMASLNRTEGSEVVDAQGFAEAVVAYEQGSMLLDELKQKLRI